MRILQVGQHRLSEKHHHKHSDQEEDIHSPGLKGFWWSHIGWITSKKNFPTDYTRIKDLAKFPELVWLNRHDFLIPVVLGRTDLHTVR